MSWTSILFLAVLLVALMLIRRVGQISVNTAAAYLREGAIVIDVRTGAEFNAHHLRQAVHIPLDQIETLVPARIPNKDQILLLHCQSGMRSEAARKKLMRLGYTRVFNLGSFARAARIVNRV